jgi:hypothetical protein
MTLRAPELQRTRVGAVHQIETSTGGDNLAAQPHAGRYPSANGRTGHTAMRREWQLQT